MVDLSNVYCIKCGHCPDRQFCGQVSCTCFLTMEDLIEPEQIKPWEWDEVWEDYYSDGE
jgi:hypothetical protein